jgi:hypothetical protein
VPVAGVGQEDAVADAPYKLQIKIGQAEFSAEGPEDTVKDAYDRFLKALDTTVAPQRGGALPAHLAASSGVVGPVLGWELGQKLMDRVFKREGDIVSLRHLPSTANRIADSAILLIYGYMKLSNLDEVPVTKLNEGLRESGLNIERLDRFMGVHSTLYRKGGQKSGGRYTLNNQGVKQAEEWLQLWD